MNTLTLKSEHGKQYVFDPIRKKYYLYTPEEHVRQILLHYMLHHKQYPKVLISVEKKIQVNQKSKRYDIIVYKNDKPWMLVECKQENEPIQTETWQQILSYNTVIKAVFLVVFNGVDMLCFDTQTQEYTQDLPNF
ncbi:MAG: type I restriction enzyme HsdR N-terminal domain-containing protein [Chitinophagaceae bacterium]